LVDAAQLLAARTPLQLEGPYLNLRPDVHGTDGFFAAVFERRKAGAVVQDESDVGSEVSADLAPAVKSEPKLDLALAAEAIDVAASGESDAPPPSAKKAPARKKAKPAVLEDLSLEDAAAADILEAPKLAVSAESAESAETAEPVKKKAVRSKKAKKEDFLDVPLDVLTEPLQAAEPTDSALVASSVSASVPALVSAPESTSASASVSSPAPAPASAIDAFAAFLAKDALNDHRDDAEPDDGQSAKPAKKPRASKTAGKAKKA
jgi:hypothetical protein